MGNGSIAELSEEPLDCIVVGGGPAGLSASLFLARYGRSAITFHNNSPRNLYSHGVHGFLGHDGILPSDLLARGREEVLRYGGRIVEACITEARKVGREMFEVVTSTGERAQARTLVLATGLRDLTPDCPGFRDFYGRSVHHCPDCDGYENSGLRIAVLGHGRRVTGFSQELLTWSKKLTVLTNGHEEGVTPEQEATLSAHGIAVLTQPVAALEGDKENGKLRQVRFADGTTFPCDSLFFTLGTQPASDLHAQLGCRIDEECGLVWVDESQQTSIGGVFAAGDLTPHSQLAVVATAEGAMAAIHIHKMLERRER